MQLDAEQRAAAESDARRTLVLAGAGSGKTRALIHRLVHLVRDRGVDPSSILLLTFTQRAAREMRRRARQQLPEASEVVAGTFHGVGLELIRQYGPSVGIPDDVGVLLPHEARRLIEPRLRAEGLESLRAERLLRWIGLAANRERMLADELAREAPEWLPRLSALERVQAGFRTEKAEQGVVDFEDILVLLSALLAPGAPTAAALSARFAHVLVDEYQDTTRLQAGIVEDLGQTAELFVVGDEAQAIYGFRGAEVDNIRSFAAWAPTRVASIGTSYRCPPSVTRLATALLRHRRWGRALRASTPEGPALRCCEVEDEVEEAQRVVEQVLHLRAEGIPLEAQAVLTRRHRDADALELALTKAGLPFTLRGSRNFMDRPHVRWALQHLRLVARPTDAGRWRSFLLDVPGVGVRTVDRLSGLVLAEAGPAHERLARAAAHPAERRAAELLRAAERLRRVQDGPGWASALVDDAPGLDRERVREDLHRLAASESFVDGLEDPEAVEEVPRGVAIGTVHAAKGLEWRAVHLVGLADGRFPPHGALGDPEREDEELRLLYVAITRTQGPLLLYLPRSTRTESGPRPLGPCRLLDDVRGLL